MRKKYFALSVVLVAVLAIISARLNSHSVYPPVAACGVPSTNGVNNGATCAQSTCHAQPLAATSSIVQINIDTDQSLSFVIDPNFKYIPGRTYYMALQILQPGYFNGFEIAATNSGFHQSGSFPSTLVQPTHTKLQTDSTGIQYMGHLHASTHTAPSTWIFQWTAPTNGEAVTFYYAVNPADSSNSVLDIPGNPVYFANVTIQSTTGFNGINEIASKISNLNVFPNPVSREFGMSFNLKQSESVSASVYSLDGKLMQELVNDKMNAGNVYRTFDINGLSSGIYLLKLNVGDATVTRKIVKE